MKRAIALIIIALMMAAILSCGGGSGQVSSGTSTVRITIAGLTKQGMRSGLTSQSATVANIQFSISAPDMDTITRNVPVTGDTLTESFVVPNGSNRHFLAKALASDNSVLSQGDAFADLNGTPTDINIAMGVDISGEWTFTSIGQDGKPETAFITFTQVGNSLTLSGTKAVASVLKSVFTGDGTVTGNSVQFIVTGSDCGNASSVALTGTFYSDESLRGTFTNTGGCGSDSGTWQAVRGHVTPPAQTFTISGRVTLNGIGLADVTIALTGTGATSATTDPNGNYTFTGAQNGSYTLTPTMSGFTFTPPNKPVTVNNSNVTGQDFTAELNTFDSLAGLNPWGIAIDASGNVWVTNAGSGTVTKLSPSGTTLGTFTVTTAGLGPFGIAIDALGNVWVANGVSTVTKLSPSGTPLGTFTVGTAGIAPIGIAIDASGNVWVTKNDSTVTKLSPSGTPLGTFTVGFVGNGPEGIAIDASGNVWVANHGNLLGGVHGNTVTKLSPSGTTLGEFTIGTDPFGIAIDASGNVWVTNSGSGTVTKLSPSGAVLGTFTVTTAGLGPFGIAIDASGNVWVANSGSSSVTKLSPNGTPLGTFLFRNGTSPFGIAIDASGNVWATNEASSSVTVWMGATTGPQFWPYSGPVWP